MRSIYFFRLRYICLLLSLTSPLFGQVKSIDFTRADSVAACFEVYSLDDTRRLSYLLTNSLPTETEKFRAIYKWVCDNIQNDPSSFEIHTIKRKKYQDNPEKLASWNQEFSHKVFEKLKKDYKTVCTGYASLVKELSYHAGIRCEMVDGFGRTTTSINEKNQSKLPNHSWNAVMLDGQWYLCDPTWSSGSIHSGLNVFVPEFSEAYFLTPPEMFALNHYPEDHSWLFLENQFSFAEFQSSPLVYKSCLEKGIIPSFPKQFEQTIQKGEIIEFQLSAASASELNPDSVCVQIVSGGQSSFAKMQIQQISDSSYAITHAFNRRGIFVLHFMYGNEYLYSYKCTVRK